MLEILRNESGLIKAVCEYLVVSNETIDPQGDTIYVLEIDIVERYRGNGVIKQMIRNGLKNNPQVKVFKFIRDYKYHGREQREYTRKQFELLVKEA